LTTNFCFYEGAIETQKTQSILKIQDTKRLQKGYRPEIEEEEEEEEAIQHASENSSTYLHWVVSHRRHDHHHVGEHYRAWGVVGGATGDGATGE
jgi:ABC-type Zn2+ transport system substrate-binding protein/surface adhesin